MSGPRVRFAPSPTGSLHLGNARTALFNWLVARQQGGALILRIEDTDIDRHRQGSEQGILDDLRWLGLDWDEGPDVGGACGPYRQSERGAQYAAAAARLLEGGQAYRCFCGADDLERERQAQRDEGRPVGYGGRCRRLEAGESARRAEAGESWALRFAIPTGGPTVVRVVDRLRGAVEVPIAELSDPVIVREDGRPTYNFAVVVDDAAMGVDLVIRGDDHLSNTPRQLLFYQALEASVPEFAHLPMVRGSDGARLSKRHGAGSVADYRRQGYPADGMLNGLALLGWSPGGDRTLIDRDELVAEFRLERVNTAPAAFDADRLDWICAQHIQQAPADLLGRQVAAQLEGAALVPAGSGEQHPAWFTEAAELVRGAVSSYGEIPARCRGLFARGGEPLDPQGEAILREGAGVVAALVSLLEQGAPGDVEAWRGLKKALMKQAGVKGKALFQPLRLALTGEVSGPELDRIVPLVGQGAELFPASIEPLDARARRTLEWIG